MTWYVVVWAVVGVLGCAVIFMAGAVAGAAAVLSNLRHEGYAVEYLPDARGKHGRGRYRVGVAERPAAAPPVRWITPGDAGPPRRG